MDLTEQSIAPSRSVTGGFWLNKGLGRLPKTALERGMAMSQQGEHVPKSALLERIRFEHAFTEAAWNQVREEELLQPGVEGEWSAKDLMAHLSFWEKRMVRWSTEALSGPSFELPAGNEMVDQINARVYEENKDRPLAEVRTEFETSYRQALRTIEATPEADLLRTGLFPAWGDIPLWKFYATLTSLHYEQHNQSIRAWLESRSSA
jgi:hypothetical protein